jgi:hypothetical protein
MNFHSRSLLPLTTALLLAQAVLSQAPLTPIEQIAATPAQFVGGTVEISGQVTRYASGAQPGIGVYLVQSGTGAVIRVNTSAGSPELNRLYRVSGKVEMDPVRKTPFIAEEKRLRLNAEGIPDEPQSAPAEEERSFPVWLLIAVPLAIAAGAAAFFFSRRKKEPVGDEALESAGTEEPVPEEEPVPGDLKTVRITPADPTGAFYLPGELVLVSGEDKGKSFRIAGFSTSEGYVVTIGREPVKGERAASHIRIAEKFHTVSRKHAELIWNEEKLLVRNLSETNPTQVNGVKIERGKTALLIPGARMRTGELEFEYRA